MLIQSSSSKSKTLVLAGLIVLSLITIGSGLYFKQYFIIFVFGMWLCAEALLMKLQPLLGIPSWEKANIGSPEKVEEKDELWSLYHKKDSESEILFNLSLSELRSEAVEQGFSKVNYTELLTLHQLKSLVEGDTELRGAKALARASLYNVGGIEFSKLQKMIAQGTLSLAAITEGSVWLVERLRNIHKIAENSQLQRHQIEARRLLGLILGFTYESLRSRKCLDELIDNMQREGGVPFLMLNLIRTGKLVEGRELGKLLLSGEMEIDEDLASTLYWMNEVLWFVSEHNHEVLNHDGTIRFLYHLCFTNPERAGFLEIDSQFYGEFALVNEIAQEGFLFKEALIESVLSLWQDYEGWFDGVFKSLMESMTERKSKIYDEREHWERFWRASSTEFSRDYLYVVEGNLSFTEGQYQDAKECYEKALKVSPQMRSALFNSLFTCAKIQDKRTMDLNVERILSTKSLMPRGLSAVGNAYLLIHEDKKAENYFKQLKGIKGWERKVDHYASTFCFEHGLFEKALLYARTARNLNPNDSTINFHLSRCYDALGEKESALQMLQVVSEAGAFERSAWMDYYRFTLERDSGRREDACRTLLSIPRDYFQDPLELEAALAFAKDKKDMVLLRHLKHKD